MSGQLYRIGFVAAIGAALLTLGLHGTTASAADAGVTQELFNGKDFTGWRVLNCEAVVEDGAILLKAGNGLVQTESRYADFILELDWKALDDQQWDSGIYFRYDTVPPGRPWPQRYQANMRKGLEGNVQSLDGAVSMGLIKPGDWNHFKLTVAGTTAALEINGKPAWSADGLEKADGYISLQAEVPGGGQFLFRNIRLTELNYKPLFNGRDFTGWEASNGKIEPCWKAADGMLVCTGERGSWLRTTDEYDDFNLRLEYKFKPEGNSGVYIRVPKGGSHHGQESGIEVQILDDEHPRYAKLKPYQLSGSLYAIVAPSQRVSRKPGQWNTLEINCRGTQYRVTHNGTVVVDANADRFPELARRLQKGFLGLQNHREEVLFRNLRIGPPLP